MEKLEIGKDYVNVHDNNIIVIDRVGSLPNRGFDGEEYKVHLSCSDTSNWREATKEDIIEAFEKHLVKRFGKDWKAMKIKEQHPCSIFRINDGSWSVDTYKDAGGWVVWNKNGLIYLNGIWVERLEEEEGPKKSSDWVPAPEYIEAMKKYTIEITDDGKTTSISRKNDGFNVIELIGFMEMTKHDLINQAKNLADNKVDIITKQVVKKGFQCPICKKIDMVWDGKVLLSDPPQYKYTCPSCGFKATRSN